jgi:hypothetical protein
MKRSSAIFLQIIIVLIGIGAIALLLWEPQIEGVNAHASNFEIYFKDPFLALVYIGSIPFFAGLYQAFKVLGYAGHNKLFSQTSVKALATIKYCAIAVIGFVVAEEIMILSNHGNDDPAGGVFMGVIISFASVLIVIAAARIERFLRKRMSESGFGVGKYRYPF